MYYKPDDPKIQIEFSTVFLFKMIIIFYAIAISYCTKKEEKQKLLFFFVMILGCSYAYKYL